ncbi:MAG: cytochrome P450 [Vicinamibacterales bacterium]
METNSRSNRDANILDPDVYVRGVPHATFARLRDEDPVSWWPEADGPGLWAVTRYDDVVAVSHQAQTFSSARGIRLEDMRPDELAARRTLMELDPPEHTTLRKLVQRPFSYREVATYETALRLMTRALIDEVRREASFDFVSALARPLPMRVLGKMLGVPDADGPWLVSRGDALIGNTDPEFTETPVGVTNTEAYRLMPFRSPVSLELFAYAEEQARRRREQPGDDVISVLLRPTRDGRPLSDDEFKNFFTLLVAAGNDTTRYSIAAGMLALLERQDLLAELRDHPELTAGAVEEMLRWSTVTMHFRRTATRDVELGGKRIAAGDKVLLWYIAGNHDERHFDRPGEFDIRRRPNDHLAFGLKGPHKCLGEHLARLEMRVFFEELLPVLAAIRLNGEVARLRSNFIAGVKRLPVAVAWA